MNLSAGSSGAGLMLGLPHTGFAATLPGICDLRGLDREPTSLLPTELGYTGKVLVFIFKVNPEVDCCILFTLVFKSVTIL